MDQYRPFQFHTDVRERERERERGVTEHKIDFLFVAFLKPFVFLHLAQN